MANLTITELDLGSVVYEAGEFRDDELTFSAAATVAAGTILARDSSTLKLVPYVKGGTTNENGIPKAIMTYDVTADAAGDEPVRPMISGKVRAEKLIIDADGDATNVDASVLDALRNYSLIAVDISELNIADNS
jgi:hypothetical protein